MNTVQTDLQQLRIKHILYKSKLRAALYGGTIDPEFFSSAGPVNIWFNTIGKIKYGFEPELRELLVIQNDLNTKAKYLTDLHKSGKIDQAYEGLSSIETQSDKFLQILNQFEKRLSL